MILFFFFFLFLNSIREGEKEKKEKTTPNPLYYRRYSSSPNFSHHIVKFQNPIYNQEIPSKKRNLKFE